MPNRKKGSATPKTQAKIVSTVAGLELAKANAMRNGPAKESKQKEAGIILAASNQIRKQK